MTGDRTLKAVMQNDKSERRRPNEPRDSLAVQAHTRGTWKTDETNKRLRLSAALFLKQQFMYVQKAGVLGCDLRGIYRSSDTREMERAVL